MSTDWLICKNATVNLKNIDNRCFQYAFTLTQHYKEIKKHNEWYQTLNHLLICMIEMVENIK